MDGSKFASARVDSDVPVSDVTTYQLPYVYFRCSQAYSSVTRHKVFVSGTLGQHVMENSNESAVFPPFTLPASEAHPDDCQPQCILFIISADNGPLSAKTYMLETSTWKIFYSKAMSVTFPYTRETIIVPSQRSELRATFSTLLLSILRRRIYNLRRRIEHFDGRSMP